MSADFSGMGKHFWAMVVSTAAYLINKCPTSGIGGAIPDERWYGGKADYSMLKPFGCKAFAHQKQDKLNSRALKCCVLGYQKGVKGYRLWCLEPGNNKIVISRDVVFIESKMHFLEKISTQGQNDPEVEVTDAHFEVEDGLSDQDVADFKVRSLINLDDIEAQDVPKPDLADYQLVRDKTRRTNVRPPARYRDSEMLFYALHVAEQIEFSEPNSYAKQ